MCVMETRDCLNGVLDGLLGQVRFMQGVAQQQLVCH